jgi:hypothetical protein
VVRMNLTDEKEKAEIAKEQLNYETKRKKCK